MCTSSRKSERHLSNLPAPNRNVLSLFKRELWKDQRRLETTVADGVKCLQKYFASPQEVRFEVELIEGLRSRLHSARVPEVMALADDHVRFRYIAGIRLFNLFVELDRIEAPLDTLASAAKRHLLARAERNQREIQESLLRIVTPARSLCPYPAAAKVESIVNILSSATGIIVRREAIKGELAFLDEVWKKGAVVPFRDATTKNMVLADPALWLGSFESEEARRQYLIRSLESDGGAAWRDAPIYDFDFSSCAEDSTPEDDPISLRFHERTWMGPPQGAADLLWLGSADEVRAAMTFLVRYYRFGGRKAAYRLLHPSAHRIRFRHDNDVFYFQRLVSIIAGLWHEAHEVMPELLEFTETVARSLEGGRPEIDYFMAAGLGEKRRYYVDMYPE